MLIRREKIGWSIFGRHYRLLSLLHTVLTWMVDSAGAGIFFWLRFFRAPAARRICVVQLNHLGDMVMTTAFTRALRQCFPRAHISVVVRSMVEPIARMAPGVDDVVLLDAPWFSRGDSAGWLELAVFCARHFQKYDCGFELYGDPRSIVVTRLLAKYCVGSGIRGLGFLLNRDIMRRKVFGRPIHETHLDLLRGITGGSILTLPSVKIDSAPLAAARAVINNLGIKEKRFVLVHPGSSAQIKEWPLLAWEKLIHVLTGRQPVLCADRHGAQATVLAAAISNRPFYQVSLSLSEFAALVSCAAVVISVDSLAGHLAAACGVRTIVIHSGVTIAGETGPGWAPHATVLQDRQCPLSPCGFTVCPYGYPSPCMARITVEDVAGAVEKMPEKERLA